MLIYYVIVFDDIDLGQQPRRSGVTSHKQTKQLLGGPGP